MTLLDRLLKNRPLLFLYMAGSIALSSFALKSVGDLLCTHLRIHYSYGFEALLVTGQIFFQWLFMWQCDWDLKRRYMVLALSISLIGSLLLLPLIFYGYVSSLPTWTSALYFFVVVGLIFGLHARGISLEEMPSHLTLTWFLYRLIILIGVIKIF